MIKPPRQLTLNIANLTLRMNVKIVTGDDEVNATEDVFKKRYEDDLWWFHARLYSRSLRGVNGPAKANSELHVHGNNNPLGPYSSGSSCSRPSRPC